MSIFRHLIERTFPDHSFVWHTKTFSAVVAQIEHRLGHGLHFDNKDAIWAYYINRHPEDIGGDCEIEFFARDLNTLITIKLLT